MDISTGVRHKQRVERERERERAEETERERDAFKQTELANKRDGGRGKKRQRDPSKGDERSDSEEQSAKDASIVL